DVEALGEHRAALVHGKTETDKFVRLISAAYAEIEPPMRENIDKRVVGCRSQWMIERDRADGHADANALRALGNRGGIDLRRRDESVGREEVLGDPYAVVAKLLRKLEVGEIFVEGFDNAREIRNLAEAEDAELGLAHGCVSPE